MPLDTDNFASDASSTREDEALECAFAGTIFCPSISKRESVVDCKCAPFLDRNDLVATGDTFTSTGDISTLDIDCRILLLRVIRLFGERAVFTEDCLSSETFFDFVVLRFLGNAVDLDGDLLLAPVETELSFVFVVTDTYKKKFLVSSTLMLEIFYIVQCLRLAKPLSEQKHVHQTDS